MKYSILLSTTEVRQTLKRAIDNFQTFLVRNDIELIVATTNHVFKLIGSGRVLYLQRPKTTGSIWNRQWKREQKGMYFMWRQAAEAANGDWIVKVDDDMLLSRNLFDRADQIVRYYTKVFQPTLLDPQGYVVCGEYFPTYTCAIFSRRLVFDFNLSSEYWGDIKWLHKIRKSCNIRNGGEYFFDTESFCWHLGYPIEGGVDPLIAKWKARRWIMKQRRKYGNRRIHVESAFAPT